MGMRIPSGTSSTQGAGSAGAAAWQQRQQSMQTLSKALQSNDLDAAKAAYTNLTGANGSKIAADPNSPLAQLGKALQSGDLSGAQQAFASMRSHHREPAGGGTAVPSATAAVPNAATSSGASSISVYA